MSDFSYFGENFTFGEFPSFLYAEFCEKLQEEEVTVGQATGFALRFAVACVAEDDRARFRKVSRENNAKTDDWMTVVRQAMEANTERPTGQPTDSSAGPEATPETSASPVAASVMPLRPDLALAELRSA